ncbi:Pick C1 protein [Seminavis robusta]|uniref:Pick C1 protein n=1 Tax=Seminavis robusta TaxID=568900 RepID=A0A9N8H7I1_9STRA|nr:Pick C1 protein [Seminavis robusta]|eukprot:Sro205_g086170.1 Pick C1 protein (1047) ;mRNA; r:16079-19500
MCQPAEDHTKESDDESLSQDNQKNNQKKKNSSTRNDTIRPHVVNKTWTYMTEGLLHQWLRRCVVKMALTAATYPLTTIATISFLSLTLIATGFFTNFKIVYNHQEIFTPFGSLPEQHHEWITQESGFAITRPFLVLLHRNGDSVLQATALQMLFTALNTIQSTPGYDDACQQSAYLDKATNKPTCKLSSATQFWNHDIQQLLQELTPLDNITAQDEYITQVMSNATFPDGTPVFHEAILGNYQMENITNTNNATGTISSSSSSPSFSSIQSSPQQLQILTTAQSYIISIDFPERGADSDALEKVLLERMKQLRLEWEESTQATGGVVLEYFTMYSYLLEFERAVYSDVYLVVVMMFIMVSFCCMVFYRKADPIQSRALVGLFSITTIGMSLMTGYGLMWCIGVPFTNISMMVPFIIVGVGLDDTFIITGAYFRKSMAASSSSRNNNNSTSRQTSLTKKDPVRDGPILARVEETMQEVGSSISLTTITTMLAFCLGAISSIPAIRWLCIYGFVCIGVDFVYQCTYFIAWMVLDERRVQAKRKDICFWISLAEEEEDDDEDKHQINSMLKSDSSSSLEEEESNDDNAQPISNQQNFSERFMKWYADKLLQPAVKVFVLIFFTVYLAGCIYSTTKLTQQFNVENYVPKGSHVKTFFSTFDDYSSLFRGIQVYFRHEDQSDPMIQQQMMTYVDELSKLDQIGAPPEFFWLRDFAEMANAPEFAEQSAALGLQDASFEEQIDVVLSIPEVRDVYGADIVRDPDTGFITASRCYLYLRKIDMQSVANQVSFLMDQRDISKRQPINNQEGKTDWSFFAFDDMYFFFELYAVSVQELIFTTVSGVAAVSAVAFVLIPHWSAVAFVMPLIIALYFMLLGTMQYSGIHINAVTYVIIVMAIGLLVDFLMHMLLRYFESKATTRHEKVKHTLQTMGSSILLGGLTTFIGVIPLAFSSTTVFMVVFKSFLAMVCLGCGVGLILLPVLLSLVGPEGVTHAEPNEMEEACSTVVLDSKASSDGNEVTAESDSSSDDGDKRMPAVMSTSPRTGEYETVYEV